MSIRRIMKLMTTNLATLSLGLLLMIVQTLYWLKFAAAEDSLLFYLLRQPEELWSLWQPATLVTMSHRLLLMIVQPSDSIGSMILTKEQQKQQEREMFSPHDSLVPFSCYSAPPTGVPLGLTRSTDCRSYNPCHAPSTLTRPQAAEVKIVSIEHSVI